MSMKLVLVFAIFAITLQIALGQDEKCLKSTTHKDTPSVESTPLVGECNRYSSLSCCSAETALSINSPKNKTWNGFNYNHCYRISSKCRRRHLQEACLYECDPYLSQWRVKDFSSKRREERYYKIPLCQKDCQAWFDDCKEDYTCLENWNKGFSWIENVNYCREQNKCVKIKEMFKSSENFCSKVWDDSFVIVKNTSDKCFSFDFDPAKNPNKEAAEFYKNKKGNN